MTFMIALAFAVLALPVEETRCRITTLADATDHKWSIRHIEGFVDNATVIVRARAIGAGPAGEAHPLISASGKTVRFEVLEQLKGESTAAELVFPGYLENIDDFNTLPVPYQLVRSQGQRGNCFALQYRVGAEYLFLLRPLQETLTPYWGGLSPMNEQVTGTTDAWVRWVRARVAIGGKDPASSEPGNN